MKNILSQPFVVFLLSFTVFTISQPVFATEVDDIRAHACYERCVATKGDTIAGDIFKQPTFALEQTRIRNCLECVSRDATADEQFLFTYQPLPKLIEMVSMEKADYYTKLTATTRKREELIFRNSAYGADKKWKRAFSKWSKCPGKLRQLMAHPTMVDLLDLTNAQDNAMLKRQLSITRGTERTCAIWDVAGIDMIYPGFVASTKKYGTSTTKELADIEKELAKDNLSANNRLKLEGEHLGIRIYNMISGTQRPSTTYGNGIYLAGNPWTSISHVGNDYGGLVCDTTGLTVVDFNPLTPAGKEIHRLLMATKILMYKLGNEQSFNREEWRDTKAAFDLKVATVNPNGLYNNFVNPEAFEGAARQIGLIISFYSSSPYFVSKYGFDFSDRAGQCRDLKHDDIYKTTNCNLNTTAYSALGKRNFIDFITYNIDPTVRKNNVKNLLTTLTTCLRVEANKPYKSFLIKGIEETTNPGFDRIMRDQELITLMDGIRGIQ